MMMMMMMMIIIIVTYREGHGTWSLYVELFTFSTAFIKK